MLSCRSSYKSVKWKSQTVPQNLDNSMKRQTLKMTDLDGRAMGNLPNYIYDEEF